MLYIGAAEPNFRPSRQAQAAGSWTAAGHKILASRIIATKPPWSRQMCSFFGCTGETVQPGYTLSLICLRRMPHAGGCCAERSTEAGTAEMRRAEPGRCQAGRKPVFLFASAAELYARSAARPALRCQLLPFGTGSCPVAPRRRPKKGPQPPTAAAASPPCCGCCGRVPGRPARAGQRPRYACKLYHAAASPRSCRKHRARARPP